MSKDMSKRCRVESVDELDDNDEQKRVLSHPSLVSFAKGSLPSAIESVQLRLLRKRPVPDGDGGTAFYEGEELHGFADGRKWKGTRGFNDMSSDYFFGICNRKTGNIRLVEADGQYCLRPSIPKTVGIGNVARTDENDNTERTYAEQKGDLLRTFGAERSMKRQAKYQKNRIVDETIGASLEGQVDAAAEAMRTKDVTDGILRDEDTTRSIAPPHNLAATTPEDAYPLEGLTSPAELRALATEASSLIAAVGSDPQSVENPGWHDVVWEIIFATAQDTSIDTHIKRRRIQAGMYLHYVLVLANAPRQITSAKREELMHKMGVEDAVLDCLLVRFSDRDGGLKTAVGSRFISTAQSDQLVFYGIVLWLTATGFSTSGGIPQLARAFNTTISLFLRFATRIGCKVRRAKDKPDPESYRIVLQTPLVFPQLRKRRAKRGKKGRY